MNESGEFSESGNPILRHQAGDGIDFVQPEHHPGLHEAIKAHVEKYLGPVHMHFGESVSSHIFLDVLWVKPAPDRPFHVLVTSGMSEKSMTVPDGMEDYKFAELMIILPESWPVSREAWKEDRHYWPMDVLKYLARFPHQYHTWLAYGHTIPNGDPPEPYAEDVKFSCLSLLHPFMFDENFGELKFGEERNIYFWVLFPLYREEMELKLKSGMDALLDKFNEWKIPFWIEKERPNTAKRKWLGLFGK